MNATNLKNIALALTISCFAILATASTAAAQGLPQDVAFKSVQIEKRGRAFVLDYSISKKSWRQLKQAGITPNLNIYAPSPDRRGYLFRYSVPLERRTGSIEYDRKLLQLRGAKTVEIELVGFNGAARIDRVSYNRTTDRALRLVVQRGHGGGHGHGHGHGHGDGHGHHGGHGLHGKIIQACDAQTTYDSEMNSCVERALKLPAREAVATVNACGRATTYSSELNACLTSARSVDVEIAQVVRACDSATRYSSELNACIKKSSALTVGASATIAACDKATTYGSELASCMTVASAYKKKSAAPVVAACDAQTRYSSELNKCIEVARGVRGHRVGVIESCGASTTYNSEMIRCMKSASGARDDRGHHGGRGRQASR